MEGVPDPNSSAVTSLDASSIFGGFDPEQLDARITQARNVQTAWALPALPDTVTLDLAMSQHVGNMGSFLSGLSADIDTARRPEPATIEYAEDVPHEDPMLRALRDQFNPRSTGENVHRRADQLISPFDPPEVADMNAVERFKLEAIDRGYLAGDTPIDGRWSPELNSLRYEMGYDSFRDVFGGDRFAAAPVEGVAKWMRDWLTPTGLLDAATELDLFWDFGAIGREAGGWGDKWRGWMDDPFDPGKLVDALTGPLDDVILPAVNLALLATGIGGMKYAITAPLKAGEAALTAENVWRGGRIARAAEGLADGGRLSRAAGATIRYGAGLTNPIRDLEALQEPGLFGSGLRRLSQMSRLPEGVSSRAKKIGEAMSSWRELRSTVVTKKAVQSTMRLGFASRLENTVLPGRERSGLTAGDLGLLVIADEIETNGAASAVASIGELFYTPISVWTPGALVKPVVRGVQDTVGRMGKIADTAIADEVASGFDLVMDSLVDAGRVTDESRRAFRRAYERKGAGHALVQLFGSKEAAGLQATWYTVLASIDARVQDGLTRAGYTAGAEGFEDLRHLIRSNFMGQIREVDEDNLADIARAWSITEAHERGQAGTRLKIYRELLNDIEDPAVDTAFLGEWGRAHNTNRAEAMRSLIEGEGSTPGLVRSYIERSGIADAFEPEKWNDFVTISTGLHEFERAGLAEGARLRPALSEGGRKLGQVNDGTMPPDLMKLLRREGYGPSGDLANKLSPLNKDFKDPHQRITLGKKTGVWKQDYIEFRAKVKGWLNTQSELRMLMNDPKVQTFVSDLRTRLDEAAKLGETPSIAQIKRQLLAEYVGDLTAKPYFVPGPGGTVLFNSRADRTLRVLKKLDAGLDFDGAAATVEAKIAALDADPRWSDKFGITNFSPTEGRKGIEAKVKELRKRMKYVAAEVDVDALGLPPELRRQMDDAGYTVVAGVEFLEPVDLLVQTNPLAEVADSITRRSSLSSIDPAEGLADELAPGTLYDDPIAGTLLPDDASRVDVMKQAQRQRLRRVNGLFERQAPNVVGDLMKARFERTLLGELQGLKARGGFAGDVASLDSADFAYIRQSVYDKVRQLQDVGDSAMTTAEENRGFVGRFRERVNQLDTPQSIRDLTHKQILDAVSGDLPLANAILRSVKASRDIGFKYKGLAAIEDKVRAENFFGNGLRYGGYALAGGALARTAAFGLTEDERGFVDSLPGAFAALGAGLLLRSGAGRRFIEEAAGRASRIGQDANWFKFTMVGEGTARIRDYARFALSPYFDLSRYSEGLVMAQAHRMPLTEAGERASVPVLNSRRAFTRRNGAKEWDRVATEFKAASEGKFDFDTLDDTARWFQERGLFAYNPTDRMTAAFGELTRQGVSPADAYETAKDIFTYGTQGRSAAELSANFIFFPFSFQKKYLTTVGRWMTDDLSRTVVLTDALQMYETLNEKYDLSEFLKEHMPALQLFQKLNALSMGISPGQFGGINRPALDAALGALDQAPGVGDYIDPIQNLFLPQAVMVDGVTGAEALQEAFRRTLPAINDLERLWNVAKDTNHVVLSPDHLTPSASARAAWQEWNEFKSETSRILHDAGYVHGLRSIYADPDMAAARTVLQTKKAEIMSEHPAWMESIADTVRRQALIREELNYLRYQPNPSASEIAAINLQDSVEQLEAQLEPVGISLSENPEDAPEEVFQSLRALALAAHSSLGGGSSEAGHFLSLYERFFEDLLGPITRELN